MKTVTLRPVCVQNTRQHAIETITKTENREEKSMKRIKKLLCAVALMLAACILVAEPLQLTAQAATSTTANANWKKAPGLKKTGAYAVTARTDDTYIRFVAPTSGVYKFTISNLRAYKKSSKTSYGYASMLVQRPVKRSNVTKLSTQTVSTAGGRTSALHLSTQGMYTKPKKVTATDFLLTRSFSMRLTKGQSVYLRSKYVTPIKSKISQYNFTVTRTAK